MAQVTVIIDIFFLFFNVVRNFMYSLTVTFVFNLFRKIIVEKILYFFRLKFIRYFFMDTYHNFTFGSWVHFKNKFNSKNLDYSL